MAEGKNENFIVDSVEALEKKLAQIREAQRIFATYTQEQVDKIFTAAAIAANQARIPLAKQAVAETGMVLLRIKLSRTISHLSISIILTETLRHAALSRKTNHSALRKSLNQSALSLLLFQQLIQHQLLYSRV